MQEEKQYVGQALVFELKKMIRYPSRQYLSYSKYKQKNKYKTGHKNKNTQSRPLSSNFQKAERFSYQSSQKNYSRISSNFGGKLTNFGPLMTVKLIPQQYQETKSLHSKAHTLAVRASEPERYAITQHFNIFGNEKIRNLLMSKQQNTYEKDIKKNEGLKENRKKSPKRSELKGLGTKLKKRGVLNNKQYVFSKQNCCTN